MATIRAVIFDMDGIIVDSEPLQVESFNATLSPYQVSISESDFLKLVGKTQPEIFAALRARFGIEETIESLIARKKEQYRRLVETRMNAMPGLHELVSWLKGLDIRIAVASSSPLEDIRMVLHSIGLDSEFDVVVSAIDLPRGKPYPDIFLLTAEELQVVPSRCIVIEDSAMGVEAAKRASMQCIAMPGLFTRHQDFSAADFVVASLLEAKEILEGLFLPYRDSVRDASPQTRVNNE